ncbi:hypothetical protein Slin14017_G100170 [Septoria linicola]|nr:hypothetical protein Slin14017_G100170 [Septoria linicola]
MAYFEGAPSPEIHPFMAAMMFTQTGHPTLGRRYMGFGASPFYAGGPVPSHQMNRLRHGMQPHGMARTMFGAGEYPFPQYPFPLGYGFTHLPWTGPGFSAPGAGGSTPSNYSGSTTNYNSTWPGSTMDSSTGSSSRGGTSSLGGMSTLGGSTLFDMNSLNSMASMWANPYMAGFGNMMSGGLPGPDDDDGDDGTWDPDFDEDDPFTAYLRAVKKGRKRKGKSMNCMTMNPMFGMPSMGMGSCMPLGCM